MARVLPISAKYLFTEFNEDGMLPVNFNSSMGELRGFSVCVIFLMVLHVAFKLFLFLSSSFFSYILLSLRRRELQKLRYRVYVVDNLVVRGFPIFNMKTISISYAAN